MKLIICYVFLNSFYPPSIMIDYFCKVFVPFFINTQIKGGVGFGNIFGDGPIKLRHQPFGDDSDKIIKSQDKVRQYYCFYLTWN